MPQILPTRSKEFGWVIVRAETPSSLESGRREIEWESKITTPKPNACYMQLARILYYYRIHIVKELLARLVPRAMWPRCRCRCRASQAPIQPLSGLSGPASIGPLSICGAAICRDSDFQPLLHLSILQHAESWSFYVIEFLPSWFPVEPAGQPWLIVVNVTFWSIFDSQLPQRSVAREGCQRGQSPA